MAGELELVLVVVFNAIVILSLIVVYVKRFISVPPDKAMVIYGSGMGSQHTIDKQGKPRIFGGCEIVLGGGRFVPPVVKSFAFLSLDVITIDLRVRDIVTDRSRDHLRIELTAITHVGISREMKALKIAAENLLGKTEQEIRDIAPKSFEAQVRSLCSRLTYEEMNADREELAKAVLASTGKELAKLGMETRSFVIRDLNDERGYRDAMDRIRAAEAILDARPRAAQPSREVSIIDAAKLGQSWETRLEEMAKRLDGIEKRLEDDESGER
ncbi:MAG TPA: flotillin family protein [Thermoplasmata archaeon]|nr:flotillin family protein [Thermoplasmata archaeon]